jgi:hypothetical protein
MAPKIVKRNIRSDRQSTHSASVEQGFTGMDLGIEQSGRHEYQPLAKPPEPNDGTDSWMIVGGMYGPPPDCKRFEVERGTVRVNVFGL